MSWKFEIFRAFFTAFGAFETISNASYLLLNNGMKLAKKQHGELPLNVTKKQLKIKVICMLTFGILFLAAGLSSYITHSFKYLVSLLILILFAVYASIEACYYKYWHTIGFSCLAIFVLILFLI